MCFDVAVTLRRGEAVIEAAFTAEARATVLFGPSGVGKTSVLQAIAGLLRPDRGHVRVAGRTVFDTNTGIDEPVEHRRCGYVFQDARLFPHRRVRGNLLYGARRGADLSRIDFLELGELLDRWPRTLSGGEARRVAIGRALLSDPAFLLLDEPTASLDRARREEVLAAIERARDETRLPVLMVTHDADEAQRIGGQVVRM